MMVQSRLKLLFNANDSLMSQLSESFETIIFNTNTYTFHINCRVRFIRRCARITERECTVQTSALIPFTELLHITQMHDRNFSTGMNE